MADNWNGNPATWTTNEVVSASKMNTEVRDRWDAAKASLVGDGSADAGMKHSHKVGTFASRPAASQAGRLYAASNFFTQYEDSSTAWEHRSGAGVYDGFQRTSGDTIGTADSGHSWTEHTGDIDIVTNDSIQAASLAAFGSVGNIATATMDSGGIIRTAYYEMPFTSHPTAASTNLFLIVRRDSNNDWIDVQQFNAASFQIGKVVGGTRSVLTAISFAPAGSTLYYIRVWLIGSYLRGEIYSSTAFGVTTTWQVKADIQDVAANGTRCGVLFAETGSIIRGFAGRFN